MKKILLIAIIATACIACTKKEPVKPEVTPWDSIPTTGPLIIKVIDTVKINPK